MRRLVLIGVLMIGLVLSLSACSTDDRPRAHPTSSVAERAQTLDESFAGSVTDHAALEVLSGYRNNGGTAECLATRGYPGWDWAALRSVDAPRDALAADPPWAAAPHRGWWSPTALASAPFLRAEFAANHPAPDPGLDEATDACIGTSRLAWPSPGGTSRLACASSPTRGPTRWGGRWPSWGARPTTSRA